MTRRLVPVGLVIAAAAADGAGAHGLAFYALLLAVPAAAVAALEAFGRVLDGAGEHLHAALWTVVLGGREGHLRAALWAVWLGGVGVGAGGRGPAVTEGSVPALARSALLACL